MSEIHSHWVPLLNAQESWLTDEAMLSVVPAASREFSTRDWPRDRALAYLHNNVSALRLNYTRLEGGEALDLDLLNPILAGVRLTLTPRKRAGADRGVLIAASDPQQFNSGTHSLRNVIHRAFFHFALYAEFRLADPAWPGATPGLVRVLACPAHACSRLVVCASGRPTFCSPRCAEDTARPDP